jgi:hypothetical protein
MAWTPRLVTALVCALAPLAIPSATAARINPAGRFDVAQQTVPDQGGSPLAAATLEGCVTAPLQSERSLTIAAEMSAVPHTARMAMRIEIQERLPEDTLFHTVIAPGLGVWREADTGVSSYKYLKKVTNLSAPAIYRAAVRFRWLDGNDHPIKQLERHTASCAQAGS